VVVVAFVVVIVTVAVVYLKHSAIIHTVCAVRKSTKRFYQFKKRFSNVDFNQHGIEIHLLIAHILIRNMTLMIIIISFSFNFVV